VSQEPVRPSCSATPAASRSIPELILGKTSSWYLGRTPADLGMCLGLGSATPPVDQRMVSSKGR
jgi:hypothetical protein